MDIDRILDGETYDEVGSFIPQPGWYEATVVAGGIDNLTAEGEQRLNKKGDPYFFHVMRFQLEKPVDTEDDEAAEAYLEEGGKEEIISYRNYYPVSKVGASKVMTLLGKLGANTMGRTLKEAAEGALNLTARVFVEVSDQYGPQVTKVVASENELDAF